MVISSRTPEGQPNNCPVCGKAIVMEPSQPFGDAPCPHCGCLLRFEPHAEGACVTVVERAETALDSGAGQPMYVCPQCKARIPFGTERQPPPARCPGCRRRLSIPTTLTPELRAKLGVEGPGGMSG
ncbi:hypothetical protein ElP_39470 [Tautonia plasticadhaerens]|uniref:Uncharacterized protein n=1 Tax=Tautonia plasticadhaerens TaxID=2527974 RepID=A0A518H5B8_9BACT|nr:hypothetical protein ElP_39470 [Tautonia plasticadhaerens]